MVVPPKEESPSVESLVEPVNTGECGPTTPTAQKAAVQIAEIRTASPASPDIQVVAPPEKKKKWYHTKEKGLKNKDDSEFRLGESFHEWFWLIILREIVPISGIIM